jgi:hypothetical protein
MKTISIKIDAGEKMCDQCEMLHYFSTGLIGEWYMRCRLFDQTGDWRDSNMKRTKECIKAEKQAKATMP